MNTMRQTSGSHSRSRLQGSGPAARPARDAFLSRLLRGGRMTKWKGEAASYAPNLTHLVSAAAPTLCGALLSATLLAGLATGPASAADRYWDANGPAAGSGGAGVWNLSNLYWSPNASDTLGPYNQPWDNGALDHAIFSGTAGAVTLGAPITANALTFDTGGYTISGTGANILTLGGTTPTITVNSGTATISAVVAGSAGLTKAGAGTLSLTGANTFTGGIFVNAGGLSVNSDAALGDSANTVVLNGATLTATGALSSSREVAVNGAATISGAGVGSALFTGSGTLTVSHGVTMSNNASAYTGQTILNGAGQGRVRFTSVRDTGVASSLGLSGDIVVQGVNDFVDLAIYTGDGDSTNRTFRLTPSSNGGVGLYNEGSGTLALTGTISLEGSARGISFTAQTADLDLSGVMSGPSTSTISYGGGGTGRTITLGGANTYTGANSIGAVTVNITTLADRGTASSLGTSTNVAAGTSDIQINNGALNYTGDGDDTNRSWRISNNSSLLNNGTGALALSGEVSFDPVTSIDALTLGGSFAGENTISGAITGSGRVVVDSAGTWVLSGANTYTGSTTVENGTLRAGSASALGNTTSVTVNGGTLDLNGNDLSLTSLAGTGGTLALGAGDLTLELAAGLTNSFGGSITGSGSLTKLGAGTLTLSGASTYTGVTNIGGGTLALNFAATGAPTDNIISSSSTLNMAGGTLLMTAGAGEANTQTFTALNITGGSNVIGATSGASGGSATLNLGAINRTAGLVNFNLPTNGGIYTSNTTLGGWATVNGSDYAKVEAGRIVAFTAADYTEVDEANLWQNNQYITDADGDSVSFSGTVSGTKQLAGLRYATAASSTVTVSNGQVLGVDGTIIVASSVGNTNKRIQGGSLTGSAGGVLGIQQNSAGTFFIDSTIVDNAGATGLTVSGSGTGRVYIGNAANTYSGVTWVAAQGTLEISKIANGGVASSIGTSSSASSNLVLEGGTLTYAGSGDTSDRGFTLMRSGAVTGGTVNVSQASANLTLGGEVVSPDGAGLTKTGAGTLTLTNANSSYTGVTRIDTGTLAVSTLANGGANSSIGAASAASANLVIANGGTLNYLGTGATAASNRGFTLEGYANLGGGFGVANAGTTLTMSGVVTGTGALRKEGPGTLVLSGTNTYTGGNVVNSGILRAGSTQAFGSAATLTTVNSGGTLDLAGFNNRIGGLVGTGAVSLGSGTLTIANGYSSTFSGTITGSGGLTKEGGGTQTMSGCANDYTGPTTINGGTIITDCIRNGGVASGIGASGAAATNLVLANSGTLQYTGGTFTTNRAFHLAGGWGGFNVTQASTTLEFTGNVTNANAGGLVKSGPGTLKLSGTNSYSGTVVQQGTLIAGSTQALGAGVLYIQNSGTVDMTGFSNTIAALSDNGTTGGELLIADRTLTLSGGDANFAGRITGTTGGLIKDGGGTQTLSGCNNTYGGRTVINSGAINVACLNDGGVISSIGSSSASASNLVIGSATAAALQYVGTGGSTNRGFTMGGHAYIRNYGSGAINFTSTAAIAHTGTGTRQLRLGGPNTGTNILSAQIVNNGASSVSLHKDDAGTWRVTNENSSFSGIVQINEGVLEVTTLANGNSNSSIGASSADATNLRIGTDARLRYVGDGDSTNRMFTLATGTTIIESSGTGAINFTDSGGLMGFTGTGARTFTLGGTYAGDNIMGVTIRDQSGTAQTSLAKNDAGTWILTANNTYTGNTVINDGKLIIGNGGTTGNVGTGEVILAFSSGTFGFNRSDTVNFAGKISGPGIVEQMGEGTTVLTATNSAGTTKISEGTLQVNGDLTTATLLFEDDEATTLTVNGTVHGNGIPAVITGDGSANIVTVGTGGVLRANGDLGGGSDAVTVSGTLDTGTGRLNLGAGNDTLVLNDNAVFSGAGVDAGTGGESGPGDTLQVATIAGRTLDGATVTSFETLLKQGTGTLILVGHHSYSAGSTIAAGTLQIGNGGTSGTLAGPITNNGTLAFNRADALTVAGPISGSGGVNQIGAGVTTLTGANSYAGPTHVQAGILLVNGNQAAATGLTTVANGATLGGTGILGGDVTVADGATLSPGQLGPVAGTLTINGNLTLGSGSTLAYNFGQAGVEGGPLNDLIKVGGDVLLDGTINITQTSGGSFGPGVYRIMSYGGSLDNQGLTVSSPDYLVQTAVAQQVNLVNTAGLTLNFWDGDAGPKNNKAVNGGDGTWLASGGDNWTDSAGQVNAAYASNTFAIFQGAAGTVTVEASGVSASGLQFATSGYTVQGGPITLVPDGATGQSIIRVGDGTADGAAYVATIASALAGNTQLVKTDLGTLVLAGTNSYTGGTVLDAGTLQVDRDANLGTAAGALTFDGGTLRNTAAFASARGVTLNTGGGTFETAADLTLTGAIAGAGALTKAGTGTLVLAADNSYGGGTTIAAGTLQLGTGGASGSITGNVTNAGVLAFNRTDGYTFAGLISGSGRVDQIGLGTTIITANNTYTGQTNVQAGTLIINSDQSAATGLTSVSAGGALGGVGTIGGDVTVADAGALNPGGLTNVPGTLTINGDLILSDASGLNYNFGQANVVGGAFNDLTAVGGDLVLDGVLNVTQSAGGSFRPGIYRIISYAGGLDDRGVTLGAMPAGTYTVQTAVAQQVNLVNTTGVTLNFWDGPGGAPGDTRIHGGDGAWRLTDNSYWTDDTGFLNGAYGNGAFAVFAGQAGTVGVDNANGQVEASGLQFATDGYVIAGGPLALVGGAAIVRVGDGTLAGKAMTATVGATLTGSAALMKADLGTLVLTGTNSYTGGTIIEEGTLQVSSDRNLGAAAGALTLDGGTLHTTASFATTRPVALTSTGTVRTDDGTVLTLSGAFAGSGGFTKAGDGELVMAGAATYGGATTVAAGTLRAGAAHVLSGSSAHSILGGATLDLAGFSQTVGALTNAGTVRLGGAPGATLTVAGGYTGRGGTIAFTTVLGDDHSATDRLVVRGNTSGTTTVRVTNLGGTGAPTVNGIKLIDVGGTSLGTFTLRGDYMLNGQPAVVAGAFGYTLQKNGVSTPTDGDWYLRSSLVNPTTPNPADPDPTDPNPTDPNPTDPDTPTPPPGPLYQPGVPLYESYAQVLLGMNGLPTLQQRVGTRYWGDGVVANAGAAQADAGGGSVFWGRIEGVHRRSEPSRSLTGATQDTDQLKLQAGLDGLFLDNATGRLIGGLTLHYGTASADISSPHGRGEISTQGFGFGGTLTWYGQSGFYVDGQVQASWFASDLSSHTAGRTLAQGNNGFGYALGAEVGQRVGLGGPWSLTPQAQLVYSAVHFDSFTDPFRARVSLDDGDSLQGRLGLAVDYENVWQDAAGQIGRAKVYGIANLHYEFLNGTDVDVASVSFARANDRLWGGIGAGGSYSWGEDKYALYGEVSVNTSLANFGDSYDYRGSAGFRMQW